ncbi:MAG: hypothetical protein Kilf2KO_02000 [Rhodospirillales bacterium]
MTAKGREAVRRIIRRLLPCLALAGLAACVGPQLARAGPERVVSMNLCTDHLLLQLADRAQLASLTVLAPQLFPEGMGAEVAALAAEGLPLNQGLAEEVLPLNPDLVVTGIFSRRQAVAFLRRQGVEVVDVRHSESLEDVAENVKIVAALLGQTARGEARIHAFWSRLAALMPEPSDTQAPSVALLTAGLYVRGRETLLGDAIAAAGLRNKAGDWGIDSIGQVSLEQLVADPPDALAIGLDPGAPPSLQGGLLRHPAVLALLADRPTIQIPSDLWTCGTPDVVEAVAQLRALRDDLVQAARTGR